jgi:hypothetical protein
MSTLIIKPPSYFCYFRFCFCFGFGFSFSFSFSFRFRLRLDRSIAFRLPSILVLRGFGLFFSQHFDVPQRDVVTRKTRASSKKSKLGRHRRKIFANSLTARCRFKLPFAKANPSQVSQSACNQADDKAK